MFILDDNIVIHKLGDIYIGDTTTYGVNSPALTHSNFVGTFNGFGMLLQNTGKTIINAIQGQEVSIRNNNTEYFYVDEFLTRLRVQNGSIIETFCDATNCYMDFQTNGTSDYAVRLQVKKSSSVVGSGYLNVQGNLRLQNGFIQLFFRNGQSLPNASIQTVQFTTNTLPQGISKNNVGGYSTQLTNNSGFDRTLVFGGNLSINTGNSGFLLIWLGQGSSRVITFQAPIENGSISVTLSYTYRWGNGTTIFFQCYQNRGGTSTILDSATRRSRVFAQLL
jgi:hypothetical protein